MCYCVSMEIAKSSEFEFKMYGRKWWFSLLFFLPTWTYSLQPAVGLTLIVRFKVFRGRVITGGIGMLTLRMDSPTSKKIINDELFSASAVVGNA